MKIDDIEEKLVIYKSLLQKSIDSPEVFEVSENGQWSLKKAKPPVLKYDEFNSIKTKPAKHALDYSEMNAIKQKPAKHNVKPKEKRTDLAKPAQHNDEEVELDID